MTDRRETGEVRRSVVIPMYQESARIAETIVQLATSPLATSDTELIFVDDGSDDGTLEAAESTLDAVGLSAAVIRLERNRGKGAAVRAGILVARGEVVGFADADLSAGVDAIVSVYGHVESGQADVAIASRAHPATEIKVGQPGLRQFSGKLFNGVLRLLRLTPYRDTQCGLKAFTRGAAENLFGDLSVHRFAFDVEILVKANRLRYTVVEVPIAWRHVEASRVRPVRDGFRMLVDALRVRRAIRPDR